MKFADLMSITFNFRLNVFKFDLLENEGFKRINSILSFLISLFFFFSFFLNEKSGNKIYFERNITRSRSVFGISQIFFYILE